MKRIQSTLFFLFVVLFLSLPGYSQEGPSLESVPKEVLAYPDFVLFNGKILTVDDEFSTAEALAIRGEHILAVADDARKLSMAGSETQGIDLEG